MKNLSMLEKNLLATLSGASQQWMIHRFSLSAQECLPKGLNKLTLLDTMVKCTLTSLKIYQSRKLNLQLSSNSLASGNMLEL
jgi:hypothetical protein